MLKASPVHHQEQAQPAPGGLNWWIFLWASVVFIVYGSLFPFNFQSEARPFEEFYASWQMLRNIPDASDNVLLFMPLGLGLDACFRGRRGCFWASVLAWLVLGVGIQLLQLYLPTRTAAVSDALWNAVGMSIGILAFKRLRLTIDHLKRSSYEPQDNYAMLLVVIWFCYESFPFVPTLDVGLLREHIKSVVFAPPFEMMRLVQHSLAAVLAGVAMVRSNWLQARWLNVLLPGGLAVFLEIFVAYGSLRQETLAGIIGGLFVGYWVAAHQPRKVPVLVMAAALTALLITVLTPFRGQAQGAAFTFTPFADIFWKGVTIDVSPSAFEALAIGVLIWSGGLFKEPARLPSRLWVGAVFALLVVLELSRVYLLGFHGDTTALVLAAVLGSFRMSFGRPAAALLPQQEPLPNSQPRRVAVDYRTHLMAVAVLAAFIGALFLLPGLPYNVRELLAPGLDGAISVLGLAVVAYSMASGVFFLFSPRRRKWLMLFPVFLLFHGAFAWWVIRHSVPMESLFDIVGSPVLNWPWEWELLGRYVALHMAIMLPLVGAILCVRAILQPSTLADVVYWVVINSVLSWPLYLVVVQWAATDNLTELIADDSSYWASSALAIAMFLTGLAASAVSSVFAGSHCRKILMSLASVAALGAMALFWLGAEKTIIKYGSVFSALQFLLSTDRAHYAQGLNLMLRFGIAFFSACCGLAALQWASWRSLNAIPSKS